MTEKFFLKRKPEQYEYQVGGSLPNNAPTYVKRKADKQLYNALQHGQFCYVLNARQMGKSSLRIQTQDRLTAEGIKCAAVDLSMIGSHNISWEQWYTGFTYILASDLMLLDHVNVRSWWKEHQKLSPVQRLREFICQVVLIFFPENIVIFIDEIDSILNLKFKVDDFFNLLRSFYNQRRENPQLNRITFVLLGVTHPSQLISPQDTTLFNIGKAIELEGFNLWEAQPLLEGFQDKVSHPKKVLKEVLNWTNGQPFLAQKICHIIAESPSFIAETGEAKWMESLIKTKIIENWESQDNPEHLKTIRDRILSSDQPTNLLKLYQQVWRQGQVKANNSLDEKELILSGLIIKQQGKLKVKNRIYYQVFNQNWIEAKRANLQSERD